MCYFSSFQANGLVEIIDILVFLKAKQNSIASGVMQSYLVYTNVVRVCNRKVPWIVNTSSGEDYLLLWRQITSPAIKPDHSVYSQTAKLRLIFYHRKSNSADHHFRPSDATYLFLGVNCIVINRSSFFSMFATCSRHMFSLQAILLLLLLLKKTVVKSLKQSFV